MKVDKPIAAELGQTRESVSPAIAKQPAATANVAPVPKTKSAPGGSPLAKPVVTEASASALASDASGAQQKAEARVDVLCVQMKGCGASDDEGTVRNNLMKSNQLLYSIDGQRAELAKAMAFAKKTGNGTLLADLQAQDAKLKASADKLRATASAYRTTATDRFPALEPVAGGANTEFNPEKAASVAAKDAAHKSKCDTHLTNIAYYSKLLDAADKMPSPMREDKKLELQKKIVALGAEIKPDIVDDTTDTRHDRSLEVALAYKALCDKA